MHESDPSITNQMSLITRKRVIVVSARAHPLGYLAASLAIIAAENALLVESDDEFTHC